MQEKTRLHYIDALRVSAFGLLILYHASVAFFPGMHWLIESAVTSSALETAMNHPRAWRLALLFFVSGMGVAFAFRTAPLGDLIRQRLIRLGLPLAAAMALFIVPQVWCERVMEDGYEGSLWTFWLTRYFTEGKYPDGNITWAHMWFVAYLIALVLTVLPVLKLLDRPAFTWMSRGIERLAGTAWIYALFLIPLGANLALSPWFPRETNALYNDGAWFAVWASWFAFGYLFARSHQTLIGGVIARRWTSAALAAGLSALLATIAWGPGTGWSIGGYEEMTISFKGLTLALAWTMILTLVGFAARHIGAPSRLVRYLSDGVFAFYIVHQTLVVAALFYLLPQGLGLWTTYALVIAATVAGCLLFFELARRLPAPLALVCGVQHRRPVAAPVPIPAQATPAVEMPLEPFRIAA
ncbi:membrane protein [Aureimonas sp. SA4125]|uniref:acyltransferase family protein n=1 Tax=Aureimonas sp. SA4125 TaxID=2826993 RepID=UPI001CC5917B|nr:acyltransferase family protein [Aureimonas sp. SA4125]BDA87064.1 membrane protein [Aureimonas sp. SA4125]